ncbi:hypothetical protein [Amycolatopsis sp. Poz14]|uniref:hypothetical protein n=1 Tax=Amycolatopsis sp. Poz14 TaxID=1447705 RepID=UPI001EE78FA3|nr:hypothetical protein [Amycolatopsis sp. Poz14]
MRAVVIRGVGDRACSASGRLDLIEAMAEDFEARTRVMREARDLVCNVFNCSVPIVPAINGPASGHRSRRGVARRRVARGPHGEDRRRGTPGWASRREATR